MVRPTNFEIREEATEPALVLAVSGELDMNTVGLLTTEVDERLAQSPRALRLNLAELAFMDSSGLRLTIVAPRAEAAMMVLRATGADAALPFQTGGSA